MDSDFDKSRRNLMVLCFAMNLYFIGGGKIEKVSMGGVMTLERPEVAMWAAWAALAWFSWRYWLFAQSKHKDFRTQIYTNLNRTKLSTDFLLRYADIGDMQRITVRIATLPENRSFIAQREGLQYQCQKFTIKGRVSDTKGGRDGSILFKELKVPVIAYGWCFTRAMIKTVLKHTQFSDVVIPYLLLAATLLIAGYTQLIL